MLACTREFQVDVTHFCSLLLTGGERALINCGRWHVARSGKVRVVRVNRGICRRIII